MENLVRLNFEESKQKLMDICASLPPQLFIEAKKHTLEAYSETDKLRFRFRLPLAFPRLNEHEPLQGYIERVPENPVTCLILLIQAGSAALGFVENGKLIRHKIIKKYMVRKKQGKAQISYLNSKGKSRAGSRVRLANTIEFFEEINLKLHEWQLEPENILVHCPIKLWNLVFESKTEPFFAKSDPRILKISRDIKTPKLDELQRISTFVLYGHFTLAL